MQAKRILAVGTVLLVLAVTSNAHAQAVDAATPLQQAETFLDRVMAGKIGAAYDGIFVGSSIARTQPQAISQLKKQTAKLASLYGPLLGFEPVSSRKFGESVVRLLYILKQAHRPIVWQFYFYRAQDDWSLVTLGFKDQLSLLTTSAP
jgi:hypothetical protein